MPYGDAPHLPLDKVSVGWSVLPDGTTGFIGIGPSLSGYREWAMSPRARSVSAETGLSLLPRASARSICAARAQTGRAPRLLFLDYNRRVRSHLPGSGRDPGWSAFDLEVEIFVWIRGKEHRPGSELQLYDTGSLSPYLRLRQLSQLFHDDRRVFPLAFVPDRDADARAWPGAGHQPRQIGGTLYSLSSVADGARSGFALSFSRKRRSSTAGSSPVRNSHLARSRAKENLSP